MAIMYKLTESEVKLNAMISQLKEDGFEYKSYHGGGSYSNHSAEKFVNKETGEVKFLNKLFTLRESYFWITDSFKNVEITDIHELHKAERELLSRLQAEGIV